jgi:hypothetical protein
MSSDLFGEQYVDALAALGVVRSYPKNTVLTQEGDASDQLYVLLENKDFKRPFLPTVNLSRSRPMVNRHPWGSAVG